MGEFENYEFEELVFEDEKDLEEDVLEKAAQLLDENEEVDFHVTESDLKAIDAFFEEDKKRQYAKKRISQADVFLTFLREIKDIRRHGSLVILVVCLRVIPGSTGGVERVIKVIKAIKTRLRMRLSTKMLKKILLLYYYCDLDTIDYDTVLGLMKSS